MTEIRDWLIEASQRSASDLHLVVGYPPILRAHGELVPLDVPALDVPTVNAALQEVCSEEQLSQFQLQRNLDFAFEIQHRPESALRFRVNCFFSGQQPGACIRVIPSEIPNLQWANFPAALARKVASFRNGLIVFSGVTGSGKTTSMAMMIDMPLLAIGLRVVISQHLLPSIYPGEKRQLALEVMFNTYPVASAIRQGRFDNIDTAIVTGRKDGMLSLDESINRLLQEGRISDSTAARFISDQDLLRRR